MKDKNIAFHKGNWVSLAQKNRLSKKQNKGKVSQTYKIKSKALPLERFDWVRYFQNINTDPFYSIKNTYVTKFSYGKRKKKPWFSVEGDQVLLGYYSDIGRRLILQVLIKNKLRMEDLKKRSDLGNPGVTLKLYYKISHVDWKRAQNKKLRIQGKVYIEIIYAEFFLGKRTIAYMKL